MTPSLYQPALPALPALFLAAFCALPCIASAQATPAAPQLAKAIQAASGVASSTACAQLGDFYWEIGNQNGAMASGSVGQRYTASTELDIASASKWVFGAYFHEVAKGRTLSPDDIAKLNFTSGYTNQRSLLCLTARKAQGCLPGNQDRDNLGVFYYDGGHLQRLALDIGLGPKNRQELIHAYNAQLGDFGFQFRWVNVAGGMTGSAAGYGRFLQKMLRGELAIGQHLGHNEVCTNTSGPVKPSAAAVCPAKHSPADQPSWGYSHAHWVERDAQGRLEAYSSPGLFGFYPWVSANKAYYGVIARQSKQSQAYNQSAACGRAMRRAFLAELQTP